jgi:hypothetical protein
MKRLKRYGRLPLQANRRLGGSVRAIRRNARWAAYSGRPGGVTSCAGGSLGSLNAKEAVVAFLFMLMRRRGQWLSSTQRKGDQQQARSNFARAHSHTTTLKRPGSSSAQDPRELPNGDALRFCRRYGPRVRLAGHAVSARTTATPLANLTSGKHLIPA